MSDYIVKMVVGKNFIDEDGNKVENKFGFFKGAIYNCISTLKCRENLEIDPETGWFKETDDIEIDYDY